MQNAISDNSSNTDTTDGQVMDKFRCSPIIHKSDWQLQLDDENQIYDILSSIIQRKDNDPMAESEPYIFSKIEPEHTADSNKYYVGLKSSDSGLGTYLNGSVSTYSEYTINLYVDREGNEPIKTPAKGSLCIKKRKKGMVNRDGEEFTWQTDKNGERHDGTWLKLSASYVQTAEEANKLIKSYISAILGEKTTNNYYKPIQPTFFVGQPELYYRVNKSNEEAVTESLQRTFDLLSKEGHNLKSRTITQENRHGIKRIDTKSGAFDDIGFALPESIRRGIMLKIYNVKDVYRRDQSKPISNPKLEVGLKGSVPVSELSTVKKQLSRILVAHLRWAGLNEEDLVPDDHFSISGSVTVNRPTKQYRREQLDDYFHQPELEGSITYNLYHRRSKGYRDILHALFEKRGDWVTYYNHGKDAERDEIPDDRDRDKDGLVELTGLAYETVRKYVRELVDVGILRRIRDAICLVTWRTRESEKHTKEKLTNEPKLPEEQKEEREKRRDERTKKREQANETDKNGEDQHKGNGGADEGETNFTPLPEHPIGGWESLKKTRESGKLADCNIGVRR